MKSFVSNPTKLADAIPFELDGKEYTFTPPEKSGLLVSLAAGRRSGDGLEVIRSQMSWFASGLNGDHESDHETLQANCVACDVFKRLEDPKDPLTLETLAEVVSWLIGESSGRPTT